MRKYPIISKVKERNKNLNIWCNKKEVTKKWQLTQILVTKTDLNQMIELRIFTIEIYKNAEPSNRTRYLRL